MKKRKPKILITGGLGFIGGHVVEEAYAQGFEIYVLARHTGFDQKKYKHLIDCETELYLGDIRDKTFVSRAISLVDGVINLAGLLGTQETINNPYGSIETNITGSINVFEACKQFDKPCVQIAVGNHFMQNTYSITKTTAERFAQMYAFEHDVRINVVRALNAYGERQKAEPIKKIIPQFVTKALNNIDLTVYGDGTQLMDMIYVKDLAKILMDVLNKTTNPNSNLNKGGLILEAGTGKGHKVQDIAEKIIKLTNSKSKIVNTEMRPGELEKSVVIAEKPYKFKYMQFNEGLKKTIKWYQNNLENN